MTRAILAASAIGLFLDHEWFRVAALAVALAWIAMVVYFLRLDARRG